MLDLEHQTRRVRKRGAPHPPDQCDAPCCWTVRPVTEAEVRRILRDRNRNKDKPFTSHKKTRWEQRNIVAWDGEGANDEHGRHYYNLLANSNGHRIVFDDGFREISTLEAFDFFLSDNTHSAINVIFGGSYDVNMILRDLDTESLITLWETNKVIWNQYRITWTPRKRFGITPLKWKNGKFRADSNHGFVLWDVFGYFQCSFVNACKTWGILDELQLDAMQVMKWGRSTFTAAELPEIIHYNESECEALVILVKRLFDAMDEAGITLERYDGAGSIATSLLKLHRVFDYMGDDAERLGVPPSPVYQSAQMAYSGGRIEAVQVGNYEGDVWRYDLNSAYPAACLEIPSFKDAIWKREQEWNGDPNSIVYVDVHVADNQRFNPVWWRGNTGQWKGQILYPSQATGAYYGIEFLNLQKYFKRGRDYDVLYAMNVYLQDDTKPFEWLSGTYDIRLLLKEAGNLAQMVLRLGMNSIYGKCAQQEGYSPGRRGKDARYPQTHNLLWAGLMTARTRNTLYEAAMQDPDAVIAFATDAVFSTRELDLPCSTKLGEWGVEHDEGITMVQAGVYWLYHGNEWKSKYRGFDPGSLDREKIMSLWANHQYSFPATLTRFCGLGSALAYTNGIETRWRRWITDERNLTLYPTGKRSVAPGPFEPHQGLTRTLATPNIEGGFSMPYPVEWLQDVRGIRPEQEGVDLRLLEEEWEDSYE